MQPDFNTLKKLAAGYPVLPLSKEIFADIKTPIGVLKILKSISSRCFLFESADGKDHWGRYSFLGFNPISEIKCKDGELEITGGAAVKIKTDDPTRYIRDILTQYKAPSLPGLPPFTGGLAGYFAYDYGKYSEPKLNFSPSDGAPFYDAELMLFDKVIAFDHQRQKICIIVNIKTDDFEQNYNRGLLELEYLTALLRGKTPETSPKGRLTTPFEAEFSPEEYEKIVEKAKHYIMEGDIFQVVPSNCRTAGFSGSLLNTYRVLRTTNPSPYMFYLSGHDLEIAGASPETLVKLQDGQLSTFPIAGTKPRGKNAEEDAELEDALLHDEKELAEHDMLVDLGRNDLGKISRFGTVKVKRYREIKRYSHVMHLVSTVTGQIKDGCDALDAITAALPAGTLSGAPKIRAMQIIRELEKSPRSLYGGAIGYLGFAGNMDACIAIRMAVKKNEKVYIRSGGGIVAASQAKTEYRESLNKAQAVIDAVASAQEVSD